jgi:hypothetical protein
MPQYEFANKKTEKLVTALYMITDCMETDDAIKSKLRFLGVELLSDMHKLPVLSAVEKHASLAMTVSRIGEIIALIEIAHMIGFVSEMNAAILRKELDLLVVEFGSYQSEIKHASPSINSSLFESQKHATFALSENMFDVGNLPSIAETSKQIAQMNPIKDSSLSKRTPYMSYTNTDVSYKNPIAKRLSAERGISTHPSLPTGVEKTERTEKILSLIKDKKEVSIKDISTSFVDCSEKTIQRELNSLISKGQIRKIGAKRWSRYAVL